MLIMTRRSTPMRDCWYDLAIMRRSGRSAFISFAVAGLAAGGLWLAPVQRPRAVVSDADVHTFKFWFSPDSRLFATQDPGPRLRIFRVVDGQLVSHLQNDGQVFTYFVFSPDAEQIAGMTEAGLVVSWDTATGEQRIRTHAPVEPGYFLMSWAPSGALLVQDLKALKQTPPVLRMVDVATNTEATTVPLPSLGRDFHLSRDPRALPRIADFINDSFARRRFDLATGEPQAAWTPPSKDTWLIQPSSDGTIAAASREGETLVATSPTATWVHLPQLDNCENIDLSPDGTYLVGHIFADREAAWYSRWLSKVSPSVRVVRVPTGEVVANLYGGTDSAFSPDGRTLAVFSNEQHQVHLWDFPPRRPWGWIIGGAVSVGAATYLLQCWRSRRRPDRIK
jgi:WD40 repeat protein